MLEVCVILVCAESVTLGVQRSMVKGQSSLTWAGVHVLMMLTIAVPFILWRARATTSQDRRARNGDASKHPLRAGGWALVVLVVGLALTATAMVGVRGQLAREAKARFDRLSERVAGAIEQRVNLPRFGLAGARGVYAASKSVERSEFEAYVASRNFVREFPGVLGFGVVERVERDEIDEFVAREQADGCPEFRVRSMDEPGVVRDAASDLYVVKHCFPRETCGVAWGLDIGSEPTRRRAAERAVNSGQPTITGKISLIQDAKHRVGFLCFVPVYRNGSSPTNAAERREALVALVYAPMVLEVALAEVASAAEELLDFEVFDGPNTNPDTQLYDHDGHLATQAGKVDASNYEERMFHSRQAMEIGGRSWTIMTSTTSRFEASIKSDTPMMILAGGTFLSLLAAGLAFSLLTAKARAITLAKGMTSELSVASKAAADALREMSAFRSTLDKHSIISIADRSGVIVEINDRFCEISGYTRSELLGKTHRVVNSGVHPHSFWVDVWRTISCGQPWRGEVCNRTKDGRLYWVDSIIAPFRGSDGKIERFVSVRNDITDRKRAEEELRRRALTDRLTGLANRALLTERLERVVARSIRDGKASYAVMFLDFDRFKLINDTLGHEAGDQLLCGIGERLRQVLLPTDSIDPDAIGTHCAARFGGDEFVVLLDNLSGPKEAEAISARLVAEFCEPHEIDGAKVVSTASIGLVLGDLSYTNAQDVLRDADTAMYEAKAAGKARCVVFDAQMRERVLRRAELERDVREAAERGEMYLQYQPLVRLEDGRITHVEALVRWNHPRIGFVSPMEFVTIAEESQAISSITMWVFEESCREMVNWKRVLGDAAPTIGVNISRIELSDPDLLKRLLGCLKRYELVPQDFCLEVTETAVARDMTRAIASLHALRGAGFKLSLDDFGTGTSSLATLHQFPINSIKLDRAFILSIARGKQYAAMLQALVQLAYNLGLSVVAEGIDTADQVVLLQALECDYAQGFYFSRAVDGPAVVGLVEGRAKAA